MNALKDYERDSTWNLCGFICYFGVNCFYFWVLPRRFFPCQVFSVSSCQSLSVAMATGCSGLRGGFLRPLCSFICNKIAILGSSELTATRNTQNKNTSGKIKLSGPASFENSQRLVQSNHSQISAAISDWPRAMASKWVTMATDIFSRWPALHQHLLRCKSIQ